MEQDGPYGGPGPIGGGPKLPAVRVDPGVGLVGGEAGSEAKVLLSNGVRSDVPLRPVIKTMEGHSFILVSTHVTVMERYVRDGRQQIAGCAEEIMVRLLGEKFVSPEDLIESPE